MKYDKIILRLQLLFFLLFVSISIWAQPPPGGHCGGGGGQVGGAPISGGENILLILGLLYGIKSYIKPFRRKKQL